MAQEFWINLARVDLFPVVQNNNKLQICHERPLAAGRWRLNPSSLPLMEPLQTFMNKANSDSDSPASFVCKVLYP